MTLPLRASALLFSLVAALPADALQLRATQPIRQALPDPAVQTSITAIQTGGYVVGSVDYSMANHRASARLTAYSRASARTAGPMFLANTRSVSVAAIDARRICATWEVPRRVDIRCFTLGLGGSEPQRTVFSGADFTDPKINRLVVGTGFVSATRRNNATDHDVVGRWLRTDGAPSGAVRVVAGGAGIQGFATSTWMASTGVTVAWIRQTAGTLQLVNQGFDGNRNAYAAPRPVTPIDPAVGTPLSPVALLASARRWATSSGAMIANVDVDGPRSWVMLQAVRHSGSPVGTPIRIGRGPRINRPEQRAVAIATAPGNQSVVVYESHVGGASRLLATALEPNGTIIGTVVLDASAPSNLTQTYAPSIARLPNGQFVVAWCDGAGFAHARLAIVP